MLNELDDAELLELTDDPGQAEVPLSELTVQAAPLVSTQPARVEPPAPPIASDVKSSAAAEAKQPETTREVILFGWTAAIAQLTPPVRFDKLTVLMPTNGFEAPNVNQLAAWATEPEIRATDEPWAVAVWQELKRRRATPATSLWCLLATECTADVLGKLAAPRRHRASLTCSPSETRAWYEMLTWRVAPPSKHLWVAPDHNFTVSASRLQLLPSSWFERCLDLFQLHPAHAERLLHLLLPSLFDDSSPPIAM